MKTSLLKWPALKKGLAVALCLLTLGGMMAGIYNEPEKPNDADNPVKVIGTRHGEKVYETLLTREEMARAEDQGGYFRVPADNRDLNYDQYFSEGVPELSAQEDFHSHNAPRLDVDGMAEHLLKLDFIREDLGLPPLQRSVLA